MEVLSPLRLGPERFAGYDRPRLTTAEPWYGHSFDHSLRFGPKPPPSPPEDMSSRISLPSIADILNPPRDEDTSTGKFNRRSNFGGLRANDVHEDRRATSAHIRRKESYGEAQTRPQSYQPPTSRLPPTPPMGIENERKHDSQPLPTLQPQHVSRFDSASFSPNSRHQRSGFNPINDQKPALNTNIRSYPSPNAMSAPPDSAPSHFPRGQKRRSEAPHTRRSRSPPVFTPRAHQTETSTSLPPASSVLMGRSLSSDFPTQQPPPQRSHAVDFPPPLTASSSSTMTHASLPTQRSILMEYPGHSQSQSISQPYSPQSSPSSTKTSTYDPRVRSASWHHHHHPQMQHHIQRHPGSPSSSAPPPMSAHHPGAPTDRYICPTCGKCFSRPSSLRIHSHSHTGEKPFRCSRDGCGKAFSVRSNMKRHEKGCHVGVGIVVGPGYLGNPVSLGLSPPGQVHHVGLGVGGLPSLANGLPGARELAPARDSV